MHHVGTYVRSSAVLITACIMMLLSTNSAALATIGSATSHLHTITTTTWGNALADVGATSTKVPYLYTWVQSTGLQYTYVDLVNVGNLATTGNSIAVTTQDATSPRQDAPHLTFSACANGTWNQTTNICSGTSTTLGVVTNGTLNTNFALSTGQRVTLQILAQKTKKALWTSTMSITVNRNQIRLPTTTNT